MLRMRRPKCRAVQVMKVFPSSAIQFATYDACKDVMMHLAGPGACMPAAHAEAGTACARREVPGGMLCMAWSA